ncbi:MAG: hypothetical protein ABWX96_04385 [Propionibacteriaceae bacterium]
MARPVARRTAGQRLRYLAKRLVQMEIAVWESLYRFVFRRPRVPPGATAFTYHQPVFQILVTFIVLTAIEIPVLDLIFHRWTAVRVPLLIAGIWGFTWMLGLLFGFLTRPHAVGPDGIHIRNGAEVDIFLAWDDIYSLTRKRNGSPPKTPQLTVQPDGTTLRLAVNDEVNLEIDLEQTIEVRLPHGLQRIKRLQFHVDDPKGFMDSVRPYLA